MMIVMIRDVKTFIIGSTHHLLVVVSIILVPFFTPDTDAKLTLPIGMASLTLTGIVFVDEIKGDLLL